MKLPTLYKRRSDGGAQSWTIEVEGDRYRTISGTLDGQKVVSEWTICAGKNIGRANATTAEAQAEKEAQAHWTKKRERNYKEALDDVDQQDYFKVMLAKDYNDYKGELGFPVYVQPKLDGTRCVITKKGMFSRNGKAFLSAPHIFAALKPLFQQNPGLVLDGELYAQEYADNFNAIISLVKKTKPTAEDLVASEKHIKYWVYDLPSAENFSARSEKLHQLTKKADSKHIVFVPTKKVSNQEALDKHYGEVLEKGFEGQIIRLDAPYENKRSKFLLKRKEFKDAEFEIVGVEEGVGNRAGTVGCFTVKDKQGKTFRSNIKGPHEYLAKLLGQKAELIGEEITIKFFDYTPDGIPRFPFVVGFRNGKFGYE